VAFDEDLAERVREALPAEEAGLVGERKMFGGLAFLLDGHMFVGIVGRELMVRLGPEGSSAAMQREHVREMDFTGRPSKGMVFVQPAGLDGGQLEQWVSDALTFARALLPKPKRSGPSPAGRDIMTRSAPRRTPTSTTKTTPHPTASGFTASHPAQKPHPVQLWQPYLPLAAADVRMAVGRA
jgi:hypothetical protein